jgi:hypothetical protein
MEKPWHSIINQVMAELIEVGIASKITLGSFGNRYKTVADEQWNLV